MPRSIVALFLLGTVCFGSLAFLSPKHPFHTSIGDCHYNAKSRRLEISIRFFTDDFEQAISKHSGKTTVLDNQRLAEPVLANYLAASFAIKNISRPINFKVIGKELSNDVTWVYIESDTTSGTGLTFRHAALTELFDDQQNLLNLNGPAGKRTLMFNRKQVLASW